MSEKPWEELSKRERRDLRRHANKRSNQLEQRTDLTQSAPVALDGRAHQNEGGNEAPRSPSPKPQSAWVLADHAAWLVTLRTCLAREPSGPIPSDTLRQMWYAAEDSGDEKLRVAVRNLFANSTVFMLYSTSGGHPSREEYLRAVRETLAVDELSIDDSSKVLKAYKHITDGMPCAFKSKVEASGRKREAKAQKKATQAATLPPCVLSALQLFQHTAKLGTVAACLGGPRDLAPLAGPNRVDLRLPPGLPPPQFFGHLEAGFGRELGILILAILDEKTGQWNWSVDARTHIFHNTTFLGTRMPMFDPVKFALCFGPGSAEVSPNGLRFVQGPICRSEGINGLPSSYEGQTIADAALRKCYGLNVMLIRRGGQYLFPEPDTKLKEGDRLIMPEGSVTPDQLFQLCDA